MSYKINRTDGSLLTEILDSEIDTTATDLTLIGKNVTGYGEYLNENYVKLLENFASTTEPNNPITGQLWFDLSENRIKVYTGSGFKAAAGPLISPTKPLEISQGDFWIDNVSNQLWFNDGIDTVLVGPLWQQVQGKSGFEIESINDIYGNQKTITKLYNGSVLLGIFSNSAEFVPQVQIDGFPLIKPGFTATSLIDNFKIDAVCSYAENLLDTDGNTVPIETLVSAINVTDGVTNTFPSVTLKGDIVVDNTSVTANNWSSFRLPKYSSTERDTRTLTSDNYGELIYNTTTNKVQVYANGTWVDLH